MSISIPVKVPPVFKTGLRAASVNFPLDAEIGLEPIDVFRSAAPKTAAIPLGDSAINLGSRCKNRTYNERLSVARYAI